MTGFHHATIRSILLVLVLTVTVSESRTWRRPTTTLPSPSSSWATFRTKAQMPPHFAVLRGGHDADDFLAVPNVPEATSSSSTNVQARGGSTTTKKSLTPTTTLSVSPTNSIHTTSGGGGVRSTTVSSASASTVITTAKSSSSAGSSASKATTSSTTALASRKQKKLNKIDNPSEDPDQHPPHKKIAKKLRNRNARNLRRKVMHASFGFFFAALNHFIPKAKFVPGMTILTSATLVMELLRYRKGFHWMNDILHLILGQSLRKHEMDGKFTGSFYYFLGVTVTAALYPTTCATLGICQLAIADPTASFFGRATRHVYWSRIENGLGGLGRNKGLLGFIGGAVACVPMNYRLLSVAKFPVLPTSSALWTASFALGFAGAFADLAVPTPTLTLPKKVLGVRGVPPFHVDDNFVVPVFSGFACQYIFWYLNFPADLQLAKYALV